MVDNTKGVETQSPRSDKSKSNSIIAKLQTTHWEDLMNSFPSFLGCSRPTGHDRSRLFLQFRSRDSTFRGFVMFSSIYTLFVAFVVTHDMREFPITTMTWPMLAFFGINHLVIVLHLIWKFYFFYHPEEKKTNNGGALSPDDIAAMFGESKSTSISQSRSFNSSSKSSGTTSNNPHRISFTNQSKSVQQSSGRTLSSYKKQDGAKQKKDTHSAFGTTLMKAFDQKSNVRSAKVYVSDANALGSSAQTVSDPPASGGNNSEDISRSRSSDSPSTEDSTSSDGIDWDTYFEVINFYTFVCSLNIYMAYSTHLRYGEGFLDATLPGEQSRSLPDGMLEFTLAFPIFLYMILRRVSFFHAHISIYLALLNQLVLIGIYRLDLPRTLFAYGFVIALHTEYHRQVWHTFFVTFELEMTLEENARMAEEIKASELRHMIGNVAHDLKTPLSSFICGMEIIKTDVNELLNEVSTVNGTIKSIDLFNMKLLNILKVAEDVTNTNAFMMMTINRCIDYNKTQFGLKLQSKQEVFLLKESIDFPIKCLTDYYDQISIVREYCNPDNSNNILNNGDILIRSDKQWLQDNLLCLIGNATKYSQKKSTVIIKIGIIFEKEILTPTTVVSVVTPVVPSGSPTGDIEMGVTTSSGMSVIHSSNSLATTGSGSSSNVITSSNKKSNKTKYLLFEILDTGEGIPQEIQKKIFDEPEQEGREHGGSGLGLYNLAKRVEALGGACGVSDRTDGVSQGSRFWFTIPFEPINFKSTGKNDNESIVLDRHCGVIGEGKDEDRDNSPNETTTNSFMRLPIKQSSQRDRDKTMTSPFSTPSDSGRLHGVTRQLPQTINEGNLTLEEHESSKYQSSSRMIVKPNHTNLLKPNLKILIVDDSPPILKMTSLSLRKHGHTVITAENGQIAVDLFQSELEKNFEQAGITLPDKPNTLEIDSDMLATLIPFDVVLMDFQMPVMDGVEAILQMRVKESQWLASCGHRTGEIALAIIGFSAKSDEVQIEQAYDNGMSSFLPKPFTINAFQNILQNLASK